MSGSPSPPFPLRVPIQGLCFDDFISFPQCMAHPVPFLSLDLRGRLDFLCPSPKFFILNHFRPMDVQDSLWATFNEGLQLWGGSFRFFPLVLSKRFVHCFHLNNACLFQCRYVHIQHTRWFKYNRDWFVFKQAALRSSCAVWLIYIQISPGHIWTTLYI